MTVAMLPKEPDITFAVAATLTLAAVRDLILAYPLIGFMFMGASGGVIGWVLAVEAGIFDHRPLSDHTYFVIRRALLGAALGVCIWMIWQPYQYVPVLIAMLAAGLAGAFPIKACNYIGRVVRRLMMRGYPRAK